jgi:hypothetical protein
LFEKTENTACAEALARLLVDQISQSRRRRIRGVATPRPHNVPLFGPRRRDSLEGYVVSLELDQATVMAEGGHFAFQTPADDLRIGQRVRFVREGEHFALV